MTRPTETGTISTGGSLLQDGTTIEVHDVGANQFGYKQGHTHTSDGGTLSVWANGDSDTWYISSGHVFHIGPCEAQQSKAE